MAGKQIHKDAAQDGLTDSLAGLLHSFMDMGLTAGQVQESTRRALYHVQTERALTAGGKCSKCEMALCSKRRGS